MIMQPPNRVISRRGFIEKSVRGAGLLALAGAAAERGVHAVDGKPPVSPFAYDVESMARTDPGLIKYEEVGRFVSEQPEPRRLAIGPGDRVYLATKNGISIMDPKGALQADITLSSPARCVGVASDGTVFAGLRDHVEVFDVNGARLASWDSPGKKTWLSGLAVGEHEVFAADSGNRVIHRFDLQGKLKGRIGEKSKEHNVPGLIVPSPYLDVVLAKDGLLRVNNPGRHCVEGYTLNGDLEFSWGKPSGAIGGFCGCCNPIALTMLADGRYVTCEKGLPRVKIYSADGAFECVVAGTESFPENGRRGSVHDLSDGTMGGLDAAIDSRGRIYVLDLVARDVRVMQRKG
jgi:hypothetical protein